MGVVRPVHVAWVVLAVATATVGFASASCGSGKRPGGIVAFERDLVCRERAADIDALRHRDHHVTARHDHHDVARNHRVGPGCRVDGEHGADRLESGASGWAYALIGAVIVALIAGMIWLFRRGRSSPAVPVATPKSLPERQAILLAEVEQRLRTGWTVVSQTADTATLERSGQVTRVTVDEYGTLHDPRAPAVSAVRAQGAGRGPTIPGTAIQPRLGCGDDAASSPSSGRTPSRALVNAPVCANSSSSAWATSASVTFDRPSSAAVSAALRSSSLMNDAVTPSVRSTIDGRSLTSKSRPRA